MPSLHSCHSLLLALFMLVSGVWQTWEMAEQPVSSSSWHAVHHVHDHQHDTPSGNTDTHCEQHHGCHFHSPVALQSQVAAAPGQPDFQPSCLIDFQYCSQSTEPPVPPPDFS